jgi:hypothetical protein
MQIIAKYDGTETDVTDIFLALAEGILRAEYMDLDPEQEDEIIALADATGHRDLATLSSRILHERKEEEEAQRRRDAFYRSQQERQEQERQAAAQLAAEMRAKEPHLAQWNDAALVRLHAMRNAGMA